MRDIVVIGAGHIGKEIATYLAQYGDCLLVDPNPAALKGWNSCSTFAGSIHENPALLSESDLFVVALPGSIAEKTVSLLLESGKKVVDVSFYQENPMQFSRYLSGDSLYIPDCGFAPGLSNILAGHMVRQLGAESIDIFVGGLPLEPKEPFLHSITWSVEGLIDEYVRTAKIILDGKVVEKDPLIERIQYEPSGFRKLEGFYSDGLRTMLKTLKIRELREITLRYPGHLERMKVLRDLGFFEESGNPSPRKVTESVLARYSDPRDTCILDLISSGRKTHKVELRDRGSGDKSSMSRLTGHTAALVALWVRKNPQLSGLVPPENLSSDPGTVGYILDGLRREGVSIQMK